MSTPSLRHRAFRRSLYCTKSAMLHDLRPWRSMYSARLALKWEESDATGKMRSRWRLGFAHRHTRDWFSPMKCSVLFVGDIRCFESSFARRTLVFPVLLLRTKTYSLLWVGDMVLKWLGKFCNCSYTIIYEVKSEMMGSLGQAHGFSYFSHCRYRGYT